jgi:hypothetical protein
MFTFDLPAWSWNESVPEEKLLGQRRHGELHWNHENDCSLVRLLGGRL